MKTAVIVAVLVFALLLDSAVDAQGRNQGSEGRRVGGGQRRGGGQEGGGRDDGRGRRPSQGSGLSGPMMHWTRTVGRMVIPQSGFAKIDPDMGDVAVVKTSIPKGNRKFQDSESFYNYHHSAMLVMMSARRNCFILDKGSPLKFPGIQSNLENYNGTAVNTDLLEVKLTATEGPLSRTAEAQLFTNNPGAEDFCGRKRVYQTTPVDAFPESSPLARKLTYVTYDSKVTILFFSPRVGGGGRRGRYPSPP